MNTQFTSGPDFATAARCITACTRVFSGEVSFSTNLAHVLITDHSDHLILAFRGSKNIRDWLTDAQFWQSPFQQPGVPAGIKVHDGFRDSINDIWHELARRLEQLSSKPCVITGHSLGGAQARLAALLLLNAGVQIQALYTFGEPRGGNAAYAAWSDSLIGDRSWRFVHESDIVPRVPFIGYRHAGQLAFLPTQGGLRINPPFIEVVVSDAIGLYRSWRARGAAAIDEFLLDHHLDGYAKDINFINQITT